MTKALNAISMGSILQSWCSTKMSFSMARIHSDDLGTICFYLLYVHIVGQCQGQRQLFQGHVLYSNPYDCIKGTRGGVNHVDRRSLILNYCGTC